MNIFWAYIGQELCSGTVGVREERKLRLCPVSRPGARAEPRCPFLSLLPGGSSSAANWLTFTRLGLRSLLSQNVFPQKSPVKRLRGKDCNSHFIDICFLIICFPNFFQEDLEGVSHRTKGTLKLNPLPSPRPDSRGKQMVDTHRSVCLSFRI